MRRLAECLTVHHTLERIRAEFLEMPGLRVTAAQVERLCGVEHAFCQDVLDALVDAGFLRHAVDGRYARLTDGAIPRPRPAKAAFAAAPTRTARHGG